MSVPKIWYTSDLHFFHEKVALLRGFSNSRNHDPPSGEYTREIHVGLDAHGLRLVEQDAIIKLITNK